MTRPGALRATSLFCAALAGVLLGGCFQVDPTPRPELTSFLVTVKGMYMPRTAPEGERVEFGDPGTPLPVVSVCRKQHGGTEAQVPTEVRGTLACPYAIPKGEVDIDVEVIAIGRDGKPLSSFSGPVSLRVVPGDLAYGYTYRWMNVANGVGTGVVRVAHLYSDVRIWVEDAPPKPIYADGGLVTDDLPGEPEHRTFATGSSQVTWFEDPTLAKVQIPDGFDNRSSPLVGQFLSIGRAPESGSTLKQSCEDDPENDGKEALLVVTGTDPAGFFVTDITACRQREVLVDEGGQTQVRVPEPSGFLPGTFGSMFIYNYSFPEGLDEGDLLWAVAGSVQEFTGTTQLTFPSWVVADRVRTRPESEWNKWLSRVNVPEINLRTCGLDNAANIFVTDSMCGHNRRNLKMESVESALVQLKNVKFAQQFVNCDRDGNNEVPFFCEQRGEQGNWFWGECGGFNGEPSTLSPLEKEELACNIRCATGQGDPNATLCAETATFITFGQFVGELAGPGPAEAGLDESLPARIETLPVGATSTQSRTFFGEGAEVRVFCNTPVRVKFGPEDVTATDADVPVPANTLFEHVLVAGESHLALVADGTTSESPTCRVAQNPRTRFNIVTKDALPELQPNCNPADADAEKARQCQLFRAARYDVKGHLRHLQPGRPRWVVIPRDRDDVCCHPGPGLECPVPIKPCP